jgi:RNA polymerase sigma-70 factor (ECF subfamily)
VARVMLGSDTAAEDAVQDCFLKLIMGRRSYRPGMPFRTWFFTILRNVCRDELARRARTKAELDHIPGLSTRTATDSAEQAEELGRAQSALDQLPAQDRRLVDLRLRLGLDFAALGTACGLTAVAAKKRVYRALARIRSRLLASAASKP